MRRINLDDRCVCPLRHESLGGRWNGVVLRGDHVPRRDRFPRGLAGQGCECLVGERPLRADPALTENMGPVHVLTVVGRRSGKAQTTPVSPVTHDGHRWLVAGWADADWVKNLRASGRATLTKGTRVEEVRTVEVPPEQGALPLRAVRAGARRRPLRLRPGPRRSARDVRARSRAASDLPDSQLSAQISSSRLCDQRMWSSWESPCVRLVPRPRPPRTPRRLCARRSSRLVHGGAPMPHHSARLAYRS